MKRLLSSFIRRCVGTALFLNINSHTNYLSLHTHESPFKYHDFHFSIVMLLMSKCQTLRDETIVCSLIHINNSASDYIDTERGFHIGIRSLTQRKYTLYMYACDAQLSSTQTHKYTVFTERRREYRIFANSTFVSVFDGAHCCATIHQILCICVNVCIIVIFLFHRHSHLTVWFPSSCHFLWK